jgi:hypothetical protein
MMQIFFERSGGFMGLRLKTTVDTADLTIEEAQEWEQALTAAGFFDLPSRLETESGADRLIYKMTVVTTEQEHTALCTDEDAPEELRPLLRQLTIMARQ